MPTSRPGSEPMEFWVDGSRRDGAVEEFYTLSSELGRGATSVVFRCEEKQTQKPFAIKVLKKTIDKKIVRTEIGVLLRLSHPNIIQLKEIFETDTDIALVLELVTGGELFDRIVERGYYSERDAAHVIKQILEAVACSSSHICFDPAHSPAPSIHLLTRLLLTSSISAPPEAQIMKQLLHPPRLFGLPADVLVLFWCGSPPPQLMNHRLPVGLVKRERGKNVLFKCQNEAFTDILTQHGVFTATQRLFEETHLNAAIVIN